MEKSTETIYTIHPLLRSRRSPRAFTHRPVSEADMLSLFEAARWSPSGGNLQPWAFIVTKIGSQAHQNFIEILSGNNQRWAKDAPLLVLSLALRDRSEGHPNAWALYDLGQAVAFLTFQATDIGLSMRQMGGFDKTLARNLFSVPAEYDPVTAIAIGYQGSPDDLPEDLRERELSPRSRKTLEEFVFGDRWNGPVLP